MNPTITVGKFEKILPLVCAKDTSSSGDTWNVENPLWGHCAVASLVAQNLFGGKILRASLENTPFASMRSHYVNQLPDGTIIDFTTEQFGKTYPVLQFEERGRSYLLSHAETKKRYKELALRFARDVFCENPLLNDPLYKECFFEALESGCQKLWVGVILMHNGRIVSRGNNHPVPELAHLCQSSCIRFGIQSRTESMIGACGHAEEFAIWSAIHSGINPRECDIYVALIGTDGLPRFRKEAANTCLRCAMLMHFAGIKNIYVDVKDRWEKIENGKEIQHALNYALGEKKA